MEQTLATNQSLQPPEKRRKRTNSVQRVSPPPEVKKQLGADEEDLDLQQSLPLEQSDGLLDRPEPRPEFYSSGFDFPIESHETWETVITPAADDPLLGSGPFCLEFEESSTAGSSDSSNFSPFYGDLSASDSSPTSTAATSDDMAPQSLPSRIDAHKRFMQDLSELGIGLYAEIHEIESFGAAVDDKFISNVVHGAARFLEIVTSYQTSFSGDSVAEEGCHSHFDFPEAVSEHSMYTGASQAGSKPSAFELDTAGIFEVLTPYIRLVHLHSLMYTKFHEWLLSWPSKGAQANAIFPSLSVGNQSLGISGKFQVELFLRFSLHILAFVEATAPQSGRHHPSGERIEWEVLFFRVTRFGPLAKQRLPLQNGKTTEGTAEAFGARALFGRTCLQFAVLDLNLLYLAPRCCPNQIISHQRYTPNEKLNA
ncbi:hypothetical protein BC567DRAFT_205243 [Phyllosticta citribraziliensis]